MGYKTRAYSTAFMVLLLGLKFPPQFAVDIPAEKRCETEPEPVREK